jgi:hypothetical protein
MADTDIERVRSLQGLITESVGSCFSDLELEHLRVLIRLTVEFHDFIQSPTKGPLEPRYTCESIFAGIESFMIVTRAYKTLVGAMNSSFGGPAISPAISKGDFISKFNEFLVQENFEQRCRLLLDLFKLQIVFAAISYD